MSGRVLQTITVSLLVSGKEVSVPLLEHFPVVEISNSETVSGGLVGVGWSNSSSGGSDRESLGPQFVFLCLVNLLVELQDDVGSVGDLDAAFGIETLAVSFLELSEETWDIGDNTGSDNVCALLMDETWKETGD